MVVLFKYNPVHQFSFKVLSHTGIAHPISEPTRHPLPSSSLCPKIVAKFLIIRVVCAVGSGAWVALYGRSVVYELEMLPKLPKFNIYQSFSFTSVEIYTGFTPIATEVFGTVIIMVFLPNSLNTTPRPHPFCPFPFISRRDS